MTDREIQRLLCRADRPPPNVSGDLAARVRARDFQGRRLRAGAAVFVTVILCAAAVILFTRHGGAGQVSPEKQVAGSDVGMNPGELSRQIREKRDLVESLLAAERQESLAVRLDRATAGAMDGIEADRDRGAVALLQYAGELRRYAGGEGQAGREYRRVIELFPDSPLAVAAYENLKAIGH